MTRNTKFISSTHTNAPIIKGDRWGYLVEMLRKSLSTGFGKKDVKSIELVDENTIKLTFDAAIIHEFSMYQTLRLMWSDVMEHEVEGIVRDIKPFDVTIKLYTPFLLDPTILNLPSISVIVSPLDMQEAFVDGNRSVFKTEQQDFHLYVDDTQPSNYPTAGPIVPIVYICNGMSDINTIDGDQYCPNDVVYPERFRTRGYSDENSQAKNGIFNWMYRSSVPSSNTNTSPQMQLPSEWFVVGNSNFFILSIKVIGYNDPNGLWKTYYFGKIKSNIPSDRFNCLIGASSTVVGMGDYSYISNIRDARSNVFNTTTFQIVNQYSVQHIGKRSYAWLRKYDATIPSFPQFYPNSNPITIVYDTMVSGVASTPYPNPITGKYDLSRIDAFDSNINRGKLPGVYWIHHTCPFRYAIGKVMEISDGNDKKLIIHLDQNFANGSGTPYQTYYAIDITNLSWDNYDDE